MCLPGAASRAFPALAQFRRTRERLCMNRRLRYNAEAMVSNPVEVPKFFRVNLQLLKLQLPTGRTYLHLNLYFRSSRHPHSILRSLLSMRCLLLRYSFGPGFPRRVCLPRHYTNLNYSNLFPMTIQANKIFKPAALGFTSESFFTLSTEIKIEHDFGLQTRRPLSDLITQNDVLSTFSCDFVVFHFCFVTLTVSYSGNVVYLC